MKNVTITLDEALAHRARIEAATRGKSLSKFIAELVEREVRQDPGAQLEKLEPFFKGPGYPGISKNWRGREALYAEREDELLRGHKPARLRGRSERARKATPSRGVADADDQEPYIGPKSTKPE
jgi:hypothetical protein